MCSMTGHYGNRKKWTSEHERTTGKDINWLESVLIVSAKQQLESVFVPKEKNKQYGREKKNIYIKLSRLCCKSAGKDQLQINWTLLWLKVKSQQVPVWNGTCGTLVRAS